MTTQNTPTPWVLDGDHIYMSDAPVNEARCIAYCGYHDEGLDSFADAAFIVKACNHHGDLVYIVEQFVNGAFTNAITSDHDETFERLLAKAHHVLSRVKGQA